MSEEELQQLGIIEQSLNQALSQRQQYENLLSETTAALNELEGRDEAYHIVGSIMIKKEAKDIRKDLKEKKERYDIRVQSLIKQEEQLRGQMQKLQETLLGNMDKGEEQ